ncbi:hypothetical protein AHF37_02966 [Paragonimus kellicotti]|nr:hypothetical protein AHF37_02966 [Paragonimus kellicotti]
MTMVNEAELAYTDTQRLLEKAQVSEITLEDLEACEVCYVNQRHDRSTDLIGLKQLGRYDFPTVYMNLEIMPPAVVMISERMDPNVFVRVRETAPHVVISSLHLNHVLQPIRTSQTDHYDNVSLTESLGSENLVYTITAQPRFTGSSQDSSTHEAGRLVSLNAVTASTHVGDMTLQPGLSTSLRDAQVPSVTHFTQQQVDTGDIVYVPPAKDIGISDKFVVISYTVTGPNDVRLLRRQLRVLILAEDNQTPQIQNVESVNTEFFHSAGDLRSFRPLEVQRDEELVLDAQYISITDVDTPTNQLIAKFERLPRYGDISIVLDNSMNTNVSVTSPVVKGRSLPISLFLESKIRYRQSGANVRADDFILSVTDGKQSSPALRVPLHIKPRILQESKWTQLVNNSVLVQENATVPLHPSVFPDSQPDADESAHVDTGASSILPHRIPNQRTAGTETEAPKTRTNPSFDFTLLPINSQPPVVRSEVPLQVKEGDRAMIDQYTLFASDPDTPESDIEFQIINAPRWGHIGIMDETLETAVTTGPAANRSLSKLDLNHTLSFSLQALKEGRVFYVNSLHSGGQESLEDVFSVRAYDGSFNSPHTVEVQVAIQPTNDEIPEVRLLKCFSASLGSRHILTPYLFSVSDKDVPRDMLQIRFTQLPTYGNLTVYWQHGEKSIITPQSPPITESYLGMLNLLYVQNASVFSEDFRSLAQESNSLLAVDRFTISVSDGIHVVERHAQILIRTANRNPPEMHLDPSSPEGIVLDGIAWTRLDKTAGGLVIYDSDTTDDDLVLTLFETPKYGVIQRLPRMDGADGIDVMDLVEDAWDIEEAAVGEDQQALARLAIAGSVGGPKAVKTLKQGDKFTKRQLETERIHYVYTGSYQEQVLHDSCVVRLSDGDFTTDPVTLRFHIVRATGRAGVQSLRYTPADEMHSWRPLEFADQVMVEKVGRLTEQVTETEENFVMQQMDESQQIDPIQTAAKMSLLDACLTQHTFITPETLVFDVAGSNETIYNKLNCNYKLHLAPSYNYTRGSRQQPMLCGHFVNAENPRQPINHFSSEEVSSGIIAFSAEDCREHVDQIIKVPFEVDIVFPPRSLHATLPIKITKKCRLLPERVKLEPLTILSGTDTPVSTKHLLFSDQDSSPTELIYMIADEYGVGSTTQFGRLQIGDNQTARLFSQYHVDTGQVIFHANTNLDLNPVGRQHVELHLFDAGDLSRVSSNDFYLIQTTERAFKVYKQLGTTEVNPYNERMQYVIDKISNVISIKPIVLEVRTNPMLQTEKFNRSLVMLIQKPPLPNALETIIPSRVETHDATDEELYFDISSPTDPHTKIHRSLTLQWTRVAFYRPVFRVCGERGLLSIGVQRHGPTEAMLHNSADVYVGMISDTAVDGEDFSLHSQKLLTFQPGEARKYIRVRLHPRSQEGQVRKREFLISLKSPTGAILGRNRQARVNPVKRDLHYSDVDRGLQILDLKEQPMHADDNGMRTPVQWFSGEQQLTDAQHTVQVEQPLSLKEWLATNELPDSQTLSATYQEFIQNRMGKRCLEGWKLFEERCYRSFSDQRLSWMAAKRQCESLNAFLTSINHEKHWNWLKGVFRIHGSYWIGLHQPRPGGTWMWHNLERVGFTNWAPEFPVEPRWKKHTSMQRRVFEQENLAFFKDEDSHLSNTHAVSPRNIPLGNKTETKKTKWGPRVCVSINSKSQWQNRPCDRPMKTGYLCMRNPEM